MTVWVVSILAVPGEQMVFAREGDAKDFAAEFKEGTCAVTEELVIDGYWAAQVIVAAGGSWSGRRYPGGPGLVKGLGRWAISGESLLSMLRRVEAGENPDMVYAEEYVNAEHEQVEGQDADAHT